jgi:hypothetical protein
MLDILSSITIHNYRGTEQNIRAAFMGLYTKNIISMEWIGPNLRVHMDSIDNAAHFAEYLKYWEGLSVLLDTVYC